MVFSEDFLNFPRENEELARIEGCYFWNDINSAPGNLGQKPARRKLRCLYGVERSVERTLGKKFSGGTRIKLSKNEGGVVPQTLLID